MNLAASLALLLATCSAAHELSGVVRPRTSTAEPVEPLVVQLDGGAQTAFVRADGSFRFADVAIGRHVVSIPSTALLFGQFQVDIEADGAVRVREAAYVGAPWTAARYPLEAEPVKALEYFDPREKFNVLTLGMNPSFLTIIVPIGLLYVLPKLTAGMDPDDVKKAQEEMGSADPSSLLAGMLGGGQPNADDSDDD
ncbi:unnamed protein product [Hyaloperonospora brassicae]|uniref:ER membrane protein complex subunit 7 beta-sandwich domain-containing protein n=1 Tax=Hyaloperonospora brassicae TaxID=162125 RepID=A0AAV0TRQ9_HYABA|nr:unnamed protein product [Hyaloperonospora brassicae]